MKSQIEIDRIVRQWLNNGIYTYRKNLGAYVKMAEEAIMYMEDTDGILIRGVDDKPDQVFIKICRTKPFVCPATGTIINP
jgi:hypothetical protein